MKHAELKALIWKWVKEIEYDYNCYIEEHDVDELIKRLPGVTKGSGE